MPSSVSCSNGQMDGPATATGRRLEFTAAATEQSSEFVPRSSTPRDTWNRSSPAAGLSPPTAQAGCCSAMVVRLRPSPVDLAVLLSSRPPGSTRPGVLPRRDGTALLAAAWLHAQAYVIAEGSATACKNPWASRPKIQQPASAAQRRPSVRPGTAGGLLRRVKPCAAAAELAGRHRGKTPPTHRRRSPRLRGPRHGEGCRIPSTPWLLGATRRWFLNRLRGGSHSRPRRHRASPAERRFGNFPAQC